MAETTEGKRVEEAGRESEGRFRAAFEQAGVGIALVGPDGRWLWVNQHLCDLVGHGHDELMGLTFRDITHPDDRDADVGEARQLLAGEIATSTTQKRYVRKDGSLVCVKVTLSLVRTPQGQPDYHIAVVEDITRKNLAGELFRTLADSIPQLCWMADPDGYIRDRRQPFFPFSDN
jgi:PAS domain S-box-containing protein